MRKQQKSILVLATITVFVATALFLAGLVRAGNLEPSAPPGSTMHTLDEIYQKLEQLAPGGLVPVAKTGQTTSYAAGDDGDLEKGVAWPVLRFTDHGDGTLTDNLTGLMWTKDANMYGGRTWAEALSDCEGCTAGGYSDWRLPNVRELRSLIDYGQYNPALPAGHPFSNVRWSSYWSSTTLANMSSFAWCVNLKNGNVGSANKGYVVAYVWCVGGGQ
ncbi:MAG: DUF1566 domain-containing protein [Candidatus Hodarchaeota archaeon]